MKTTEFRVGESVGLMDFLVQRLPGVSRTRVKEMLAHEVYVDGRRVTQYNYPLQEGMVVELRRKGVAERSAPQGLDIVYEDQHLMVVNKHSGLLSYSRRPQDETVITVLNRYLESTRQRCHAHVVHRLDRDTSGLMVVSKSKEVSQRFEADWKGLVTRREYVAVAWGSVEKDEGTIRSWFTDGEYCVLSSPVDNGGKEAVTHYKVLRRSRRYTLLELHLDTGRRNQIRVHLRELQHPVVHDPMYGYKDDISPINRLALHARSLHFRHPVTGRQLHFDSPVPQSFERLMEL